MMINTEEYNNMKATLYFRYSSEPAEILKSLLNSPTSNKNKNISNEESGRNASVYTQDKSRFPVIDRNLNKYFIIKRNNTKETQFTQLSSTDSVFSNGSTQFEFSPARNYFYKSGKKKFKYKNLILKDSMKKIWDLENLKIQNMEFSIPRKFNKNFNTCYEYRLYKLQLELVQRKIEIKKLSKIINNLSKTHFSNNLMQKSCVLDIISFKKKKNFSRNNVRYENVYSNDQEFSRKKTMDSLEISGIFKQENYIQKINDINLLPIEREPLQKQCVDNIYIKNYDFKHSLTIQNNGNMEILISKKNIFPKTKTFLDKSISIEIPPCKKNKILYIHLANSLEIERVGKKKFSYNENNLNNNKLLTNEKKPFETQLLFSFCIYNKYPKKFSKNSNIMQKSTLLELWKIPKNENFIERENRFTIFKRNKPENRIEYENEFELLKIKKPQFIYPIKVSSINIISNLKQINKISKFQDLKLLNLLNQKNSIKHENSISLKYNFHKWDTKKFKIKTTELKILNNYKNPISKQNPFEFYHQPYIWQIKPVKINEIFIRPKTNIYNQQINNKNIIPLLHNSYFWLTTPIKTENILIKGKKFIKQKNHIINNESFKISKLKKQTLNLIKNDCLNSKNLLLHISKNPDIFFKNTKNKLWNNLIEQGSRGVDLLAPPKESRRLTLGTEDYFIDTNHFEIKPNNPIINFDNYPKLTPIKHVYENYSFIGDNTKKILNSNYISNENNFTDTRNFYLNKINDFEIQKNVSFAIINEDQENTIPYDYNYNNNSTVNKNRLIFATISKVENKNDSFDESFDPLGGIRKHKNITKYDKYFAANMKKNEDKYKRPVNVVTILNKNPRTKKVEFIRDYGIPKDIY